jgi:hypothetical protein
VYLTPFAATSRSRALLAVVSCIAVLPAPGAPLQTDAFYSCLDKSGRVAIAQAAKQDKNNLLSHHDAILSKIWGECTTDLQRRIYDVDRKFVDILVYDLINQLDQNQLEILSEKQRQKREANAPKLKEEDYTATEALY